VIDHICIEFLCQAPVPPDCRLISSRANGAPASCVPASGDADGDHDASLAGDPIRSDDVAVSANGSACIRPSGSSDIHGRMPNRR